jgi:hypothetical protein
MTPHDDSPTGVLTGGRTASLIDGFGRTISYLRVSVTDRCDLLPGASTVSSIAPQAIGEARSQGCVITFSLKRGRSSEISSQESLELTH